MAQIDAKRTIFTIDDLQSMPSQNLSEDSEMSECVVCKCLRNTGHTISGFVCQACAPSLMPTAIPKLKFLEVGPYGTAPEGTYRVRLKSIKDKTTASNGNEIIVNEKLELQSGYDTYHEALDNVKDCVTVQVIHNKKVKPMLLKDLSLGVGLRDVDETDDMFLKLKDSIKEHGVLSPISITSDGRVVDGAHRFKAAQALGMHSIPCQVVSSDERQLAIHNLMCSETRVKTDPIQYAKALKRMLDRELGLTIEGLASKLSVAPDWIRAQLKLIGYNVSTKSASLRTSESAAMRYGEEFVIQGKRDKPMSTFVVKSNKVRCLEPNCKMLIANAKDYRVDREAHDWFCKKHKGNKKGYESFPLYDRDGDTIWIGKGFEIVKIKDMEDSHLTNTLVFLETNAKKRCQLTGLPESKWLSKAGNRYPLLLDEAKRRDEKLKCACDDGILQVSITDPETLKVATETSLCTNCVRGEDRRKAKLLTNTIVKDAAKRKKTLTIQVATMMIVALLTGGSYYGGMQFVHLVIKTMM